MDLVWHFADCDSRRSKGTEKRGKAEAMGEAEELHGCRVVMERMIVFEWLLVIAGALDGFCAILQRHDMGLEFLILSPTTPPYMRCIQIPLPGQDAELILQAVYSW